MSFVDALKTEANYTQTLNGAKTHASTGDACLDFFSVAGGMRYHNRATQCNLFTRAYIENPELAMKLLFHIRDIRGGMGERDLFRTLLRYVAVTWPQSAKKNAALVSKYGRWDDLLCLMGSPAEENAVSAIKTQLQEDMGALALRDSGQKDAHISLLAKWLPSDNASSRRTRGNAKVMMRLLNMTRQEYRATLTRLRAAISLTERRLTSGHPERIHYEAVPAGAMLKYRQAFVRKDKERFISYLADVSENPGKMHASTLYPYEIVRPLFKRLYQNFHSISQTNKDTLDVIWNALPKEIAQRNALSIVDTSGSMYYCYGGGVMPALISQAMGLYCAERCQGIFHNLLMTFESTPHLVEIKGATLMDKLSYIRTLPWGFSTNLEAVFDLILNTALNANARQDELPEVLYIFSDMEFNYAVRNTDKTVYQNAQELFQAYGYQMPAVVFHNVNSWQMQVPVTAHTQGAALVSGASTTNFQYTFDGNITPMSHMLRVLNSPRYEAVHA